MLKTLGTTARQIRKIVYKKAIKLSLVGIPLGLVLGWPIGRLLLPFIVDMLTDDMRVVTTINPVIFLVAIVFSLITVFISCQKPAALAAKVSPMEALHYCLYFFLMASIRLMTPLWFLYPRPCAISQ